MPDLRGKFIRGWDDGRGIDSGRALLSWQKGTLVGAKDDNDNGNDISYLSNSNVVDYGSDAIPSAEYSTTYLAYLNIASNAIRNPASIKPVFFSVTRPRNVAFNYIVRAV